MDPLQDFTDFCPPDIPVGQTIKMMCMPLESQKEKPLPGNIPNIGRDLVIEVHKVSI